MQVSDVHLDRLRELAAVRAPDGGKVLSLFLNLDPQELGTGEARASVVTSALDQAAKREQELELPHDARMALRADLDRARAFLEGDEFPPKGAHGVALYAAQALGLFEVLRLPRPIEAEAIVADTPHVEPLVVLAERERVAVLLVSRKNGRIFAGTVDALEEIAQVEDDVKNQHSQGGWSQNRYERSVDEETRDHLRRAGDALLREHERRPFQRLLVAAPDEVIHGVREGLHPYLKERLAGRISLDVDLAGADEVRAQAQGVLDELDRERERQLLERLEAELNRPDGRAAAGLDEVLGALNEQRVETLLYADGFSAPGVADVQSAWLGVGEDRSPITGEPVEPRANILEDALHAAFLQAARVWRVRFEAEPLARREGIAAILRF